MTKKATTTEDEVSQLRSKAHSLAQKTLRERHRDEFNTLKADYARQLGIEWSPKPTPQERAAEQLHVLLEQYPELRQQVAQDDA